MFIISVFAFLFSSCTEDDSNNILNDPDYFPNTVGSYWVYERYDSLAEKKDTVTVSITGDTLIYGDNYNVWNYIYSYRIDTLLVLQTNDSVIFYNPRIDRITQIYIVPFETGDIWTNPDHNVDSSYVSDVLDLTIDGINYHDAVFIERNAHDWNDYLTENIWIKPGIGLIKLERTHFVFGPYKIESWFLIEKSIH